MSDMGSRIVIEQREDGTVVADEEEKKSSGGGCGCCGCLLEIIAFILICHIFGCSWARDTVKRCVGDIHRAWISVGGEAK